MKVVENDTDVESIKKMLIDRYENFMKLAKEKFDNQNVSYSTSLCYSVPTVTGASTMNMGNMIRCKDENIHYVLSFLNPNKVINNNITVKNLFILQEVMNWNGVVLENEILNHVTVGNIVRVPLEYPNGYCGFYFRIIDQIDDVFYGVWEDPYNSGWFDDMNREKVPWLVRFKKCHISEIPTTWEGNENLIEHEVGKTYGYSITGGFDNKNKEPMK